MMLRFLRQSRYASRLALKLPLFAACLFRRRSVVAEHEQSQSHHKTRGAEDDERLSANPCTSRADGRQRRADKGAETSRRMVKGQRPATSFGKIARQDTGTEGMLRARAGIDGHPRRQELRIAADEKLRHGGEAHDYVADAEYDGAFEKTGEKTVDQLGDPGRQNLKSPRACRVEAGRSQALSLSPER